MSIQDYLIYVAFVCLPLAVLGIPLVVSCLIVSCLDIEHKAKIKLSIRSTVVVMGITVTVTAIVAPIWLADNFLAPQLAHDGHIVVPRVIYFLSPMVPWIIGLSYAIANVVIPLRQCRLHKLEAR